jgi:aryl-alcohol dehydrogenase-like predicted oxidoreductase
VKEVSKDDFRSNNPKYSGDNLKANADRFAPLMALARELAITPAQLALAWLLHQGENIVPIPGSRKKARVSENAAAANVRLSPQILKQIDKIASVGSAAAATLVS